MTDTNSAAKLSFSILELSLKTQQVFSKILFCLIHCYDSTMNVHASLSFSSKYSFWTTYNFDFHCHEFLHEKTASCAYDVFRKRSTSGNIPNIPQSFYCKTKVSEAVTPTDQLARGMAR